jgi:hypothetical protein
MRLKHEGQRARKDRKRVLQAASGQSRRSEHRTPAVGNRRRSVRCSHRAATGSAPGFAIHAAATAPRHFKRVLLRRRCRAAHDGARARGNGAAGCHEIRTSTADLGAWPANPPLRSTFGDGLFSL